MSINKKKASNSGGNRALQLFIDRHHLIKHFAEYINHEAVAEKILFFYGGGGNGKSLLLKFLRTKCCHRFAKQRWQEILNEKDLKQLAGCIAIPNNTNNFEQVPAVLHDFGLQLIGDDKPKDAFYGLLMLRRNIGINANKLKYKLRFPLFDFACVWYLHQKHQLSKEKWQELFPQEEFDFIMQMVDTLSETSWGAQERGEDWYRIHDLLRRLNYEKNNKTTRQAHQVLEKYYREKGEVAEAIYHANRLDWEGGVKEWVKEFDKALKLSFYNECRIFLEIRNELVIQSDFLLGKVSLFEGYYFATLALYPQAEQEYLEAIASYDKVIKVALDNIDAHNNKGIALQSLGDLQTVLSQHQDALNSYSQAIVSFDEALNHAPDYIKAHNNKGIALIRLGDLQVDLSQKEEAIKSFQAALAEFNHSLKIAPDDEEARNLRDKLQEFLDDLK